MQAWNLMGGQIDWTALPYCIELFGIDDPAQFIDDLVTIRDFQSR